ncbi:MAG: CHASE2 domain-containing protein [Bryobacteraceae bacterium]|nr:CHASE2 domain-containing protein [Bryobacteraceae bacterium]
MKRPAQRRLTPGYLGVLAASFLVAVTAGWLSLASLMDRDAYDWMSRAQPPAARSPQSVVLAFDEKTLLTTGGMRNLRSTLANALEAVNRAGPAVVSIDILLSEPAGVEEDARLASVLSHTPNLVLASDVIPDLAVWEEPIPAFRAAAKAVGHVHAAPNPVSRVLPLEVVGGRDRRWAMALEAARLKLGVAITESPTDIELGDVFVPAPRTDSRADSRSMFIRYRDGVPVVSIADLLKTPGLAGQFRGKAVFVGVTAQTAARDRLVTPLGRMMSGVEIHAQAFETIVGREFLVNSSLSMVVATCFIFTALNGLVFVYLPGWRAYVAGAGVLVIAHITPHVAFSQGVILSYLATVWSAWLSAVAAAGWQYFVVRRALQRSESDKQRYQQAIHFVTHEMRSPLTAIQGSSELMGRYNLTDDKRKQMALMINNESKRLAKMIQTFLDIERLTDGQMELRTDPFELAPLLEACVGRVRVLAERKNIQIDLNPPAEAWAMRGDRELMEYAVYNLLTNAVKYSPADTSVTVETRGSAAEVRILVTDQGMGMDEKELKNIGRKFYRTRRAEASGEAGTGIGLSLVQQIVAHHQGRMEVQSTPGKGSCFTMVLPAALSSEGRIAVPGGVPAV